MRKRSYLASIVALGDQLAREYVAAKTYQATDDDLPGFLFLSEADSEPGGEAAPLIFNNRISGQDFAQSERRACPASGRGVLGMARAHADE